MYRYAKYTVYKFLIWLFLSFVSFISSRHNDDKKSVKPIKKAFTAPTMGNSALHSNVRQSFQIFNFKWISIRFSHAFIHDWHAIVHNLWCHSHYVVKAPKNVSRWFSLHRLFKLVLFQVTRLVSMQLVFATLRRKPNWLDYKLHEYRTA